MKICQYNIYFGHHPGVKMYDRINDVCKCILKQNPDVICLQEVLYEAHELIFTALSETYPFVYPNMSGDAYQIKSYDTMIFSRYPITKPKTYPFLSYTTMGRDLKLVVVTDKDSNEYYICTSHFESEFRDGCAKKIYQYESCSDILRQLYEKTKIPIFLCADTNVCSISEHSFHEAFSYVKGWRDAWIENGSSKTEETTFDPNTNPLLKIRYIGMDNSAKQRFVSRLDRILHMSDLHTIDFKMFGTESDQILSDHYGIVCTVTKTKPEDRRIYVSPTFLIPNTRKANDPFNDTFNNNKRNKTITKKLF